MSTDIASLNISIDSSDTRNATQSLGKLEGQSKQTETATERMTREFNQANREMRQTGDQARSLSGRMGRLSTIMTGVGSAVAGIGLTMFARELFNTGLEVDRLNRSFEAIFGTTASAQAEMEFLRAEAERLGQSFYTLAPSFKQIAAAAKDTAFEGKEVRDIFSAVTEASTALSLSSDETSNALRALSQMISKGSVQSEELKGQLGEALPGAFQVAAKAMGVSTKELGKMLDKGEVLAGDLLPRLADELHNTYGAAAETSGIESAQSAVNRFSEEWTDLKGNLANMDAAVGGINALTAALSFLNDELEETHEFSQMGSVISIDPKMRKWIDEAREQAKGVTDELIMNSERARREVLGNVHQMEEVVVTANKEMAEATKEHKEEVEDLSETYDKMYNLGAFISERRAIELHAASARHSVEEWTGANDEVERDTKETHQNTTSEIDKIYERMLENIQDEFADTIYDMLDGQLDSWGDFFDSILDMFKHMVAEMAAVDIMRGIFQVPGVKGAGLFTGGQGSQGVLGNLFGGSGGSSFSFSSVGNMLNPRNAVARLGLYGPEEATVQTSPNFFQKNIPGLRSVSVGQGLMAAGGLYQIGTNIGGFGQTAQGTASTMSGGLKVASAVPGPHSPFTMAASAAIDLANAFGAFKEDIDDTDFEAFFGEGLPYMDKYGGPEGAITRSGGTDVVNFAEWEGAFGTRTYDFGRDTGDAGTGAKLGRAVHNYVVGMVETLDSAFDQSVDDILNQESLLIKVGDPESAEELINKINEQFFNTYADALFSTLEGYKGPQEIFAQEMSGLFEGVSFDELYPEYNERRGQPNATLNLDKFINDIDTWVEEIGTDKLFEHFRYHIKNIQDISKLTDELGGIDTRSDLLNEIKQIEENMSLLDADFLKSIQQEGESLADAFVRSYEVLDYIPDSIEKMRESIEEGATKAQAFKELELEFQYVSSVLTPAIQQGLNESVQSLSFEDFKQGLTTNIENQMKQAVLTAAQQDFTKNIIQGAFDEVGSLQDLMADYFAGDISLDELTSTFDDAMDKIEAAMDEEEFQKFADVLEELGLVATGALSSFEHWQTKLKGVSTEQAQAQKIMEHYNLSIQDAAEVVNWAANATKSDFDTLADSLDISTGELQGMIGALDNFGQSLRSIKQNILQSAPISYQRDVWFQEKEKWDNVLRDVADHYRYNAGPQQTYDVLTQVAHENPQAWAEEFGISESQLSQYINEMGKYYGPNAKAPEIRKESTPYYNDTQENAGDILRKRVELQQQIAEITNDAALAEEVLRQQRQIELGALKELDPALVGLQKQIYALSDAAKAADKEFNAWTKTLNLQGQLADLTDNRKLANDIEYQQRRIEIERIKNDYGEFAKQIIDLQRQVWDAQEQKEIIEKQREVADAWDRVADRVDNLIASINSSIELLKYSDLNIELPRQKAHEAQQDYAELFNAAVSEGAGVTEVQDYLGFVSTYLRQSQDAYKSSGQYQQIYESAMGDVERVKSMAVAGSYDEAIYKEITGQTSAAKGVTSLLNKLANETGIPLQIDADSVSSTTMSFLSELSDLVMANGWNDEVVLRFITTFNEDYNPAKVADDLAALNFIARQSGGWATEATVQFINELKDSGDITWSELKSTLINEYGVADEVFIKTIKPAWVSAGLGFSSWDDFKVWLIGEHGVPKTETFIKQLESGFQDYTGDFQTWNDYKTWLEASGTTETFVKEIEGRYNATHDFGSWAELNTALDDAGVSTYVTKTIKAIYQSSDLTASGLEMLLREEGVPNDIIATVTAQISGEVQVNMQDWLNELEHRQTLLMERLAGAQYKGSGTSGYYDYSYWYSSPLKNLEGSADVNFPSSMNVRILNWPDGVFAADNVSQRNWQNDMLEKNTINLRRWLDHNNIPYAAEGGIFEGPTSGYPATLHGREAVLPLPNGQDIPVMVHGSDSQEIAELREQNKLLRQLIETVEAKDTAPNITVAMDKKQLKNEIRNEVKERTNRQAM